MKMEKKYDNTALAADFRKLCFNETRFNNLMSHRVWDVLLIANPYDAFMLEDDGHIEEKLFTEYTALNLSRPPRFSLASNHEEAVKALASRTFDLVVCMPAADNSDVFVIAREIKQRFLDVPMVVLTPFSHGIAERMEREDLSIFMSVFCWLGNTDLILSIIKLIEDRQNLEDDAKEGVQVILLVEDSIRYYSSILPILYKFVLEQSIVFASEALNTHQQMLRKRGRPKIVLARDYEEAWGLYNRYRNNIQGVISDGCFPRMGHNDEHAGEDLLRAIREDNPHLPLVLESNQVSNRDIAESLHVRFIDKNSRHKELDICDVVKRDFGFGDFIVINPKTREPLFAIHNLKELQENIFTIPPDSLFYSVSHNHVSRWLYSRAMFPLADFIRSLSCESEEGLAEHRQIIFDAILAYRKMKNSGVVADFSQENYDRYSNFVRIGEGSLGGKGRGLAFLDHVLKRHPEMNEVGDVRVMVPRTVVVCTDVFDRFMEDNNLFEVALSDVSDEDIVQQFLKGDFREEVRKNLSCYLKVVQGPVAIRSSSLLEDAHYQPFAGIYATYMIPYREDKEEMLRLLLNAIKSVYASVYRKDSKAYIEATSNVIDEEKMAVVLQEVAGTHHDNLFYPDVSGVLRSLNFYPVGYEEVEEGVVNMAFGLGKYVVDGGQTLRFSPFHPEHVLQLSELDLALRETQTSFYAMDLNADLVFSSDESMGLVKMTVRKADKLGLLNNVASTYNPYDQRIYDGVQEGGRKLITFANYLKYNKKPLVEILKMVKKVGEDEMRRPVEIEFAFVPETSIFYLLQIRPIVDSNQALQEDLAKADESTMLLKSTQVLGHGIMDDVYDVIYVKTEHYSRLDNEKIALEVEELNAKMRAEGKGYILIGPGRWGSSDSSLGAPVRWSQIANVRVMVEQGLEGYYVEPSQGTHFFQNLTSFGVGYFTVDENERSGFLRTGALEQMTLVEETEHMKHVKSNQPLLVKMDGKKRLGYIALP
jgi:hypothetical protein